MKFSGNLKWVKNIITILFLVVIRISFLWMAIYGLYWAFIGSSHTNFASLSIKFPDEIAKGVSYSISFGYLLPLFLLKKPFYVKLTLVMILIISSSLALNTMQMSEIQNSENRFENDILYNRYLKDYNNLRETENLTEQTIIIQSEKRLYVGARQARLRLVKIKKDIKDAKSKLELRESQLLVKGSVQNEAFVTVWYTILSNIPYVNISTKAISITSNIMFSITNDMLIIVFSYVIKSILGGIIFLPILLIKHITPELSPTWSGSDFYSVLNSHVNNVNINTRKLSGSKAEVNGSKAEVLPNVCFEANKRLLSGDRGVNNNKLACTLINISSFLYNLKFLHLKNASEVSGSKRKLEISSQDLILYYYDNGLKSTKRIAQLVDRTERWVRYVLSENRPHKLIEERKND